MERNSNIKPCCPFVSVAVLCYNGSETVMETLDSIKNQINIDLMSIEIWISDDCSIDNSLDVIHNWICLNKKYFFDINLISNKKNCGINKTANKLWASCRAKWIKTIAADDILKDDCLKENIDFVLSNKNVDIVVSKMERFIDNINNIVDEKPNAVECDILIDSFDEQVNRFLRKPFNVAPTAFIRRSTLSSVGYAPENYRNFEDLPLWIRLFKNGIKFHFIDRVTVYYRLGDSVSNSKSKMFNYEMSKILLDFYRKEIRGVISGVSVFYYYENIIDFKVRIFICEKLGNRINTLNKIIYKLSLIFRPLSLYQKIKAR
ncbi:glycosyltransferase [Aliivibrio fischeri]|uniref:glycosyltransferase n=1 Tax=Aliivibrio fischeri TaxID=668 RepID=UPI0007C438AC|nr:glycosyltransferase [Aliivibrio fischeri]